MKITLWLWASIDTKKLPSRRIDPGAIVARMVLVPVLGIIFFFVLSPATPLLAPGTDFVTRSGSHLLLDGHEFRFSGTNIYWPTLTDFGGTAKCTDSETSCRYPTHFEVDDVLAAAQEMGATLVRSHAAVSIGCGLCLQASPGGPGNESTLEHLDYFIKAARDQGIRVILPLVDYWHYYQGGIHDYASPGTYAIVGVSPTFDEQNAFFTDPTLISAFEDHIRLILDRVNAYTGVMYKDDPTILAWELGNEIDNAPGSWIRTITAYIKSIDPNHLVAFSQTVGATGGLNPASLSVPGIDIEDDHLYPPNTSNLQVDAAASAEHNKVYMVGEYSWTMRSLGAWLAAIEADPDIAGDLFWSLQSHRPTYGTWDDRQYNGTYPGATPSRRRAFQLLRAHAYAMQGRALPAGSMPGAPLITSIAGNQIAWRGTAVAASYSVERSTAGPNTGYTVICNRCATDYQTPWTDASQPSGSMWYRVRAFNVSGNAGPYAHAYRVVVDPLTSWRSPLLMAHSAGLNFDGSNASLFGGDRSRAFRSANKASDFIIWKLPGMTSFQAITYFWPDEAVSPFSVYTSADGTRWMAVTPAIAGGSSGWLEYTYTLSNLSGVNFVKMVWNNGGGVSWSPQISRVTIAG